MTREFFLGADDVLRGRSAPDESGKSVSWSRSAAYVVVFGCAYGALMGTFGGVTGGRLWMVLFSALKVPLLLLVTFLVCIPSFFVLNTLLGVRSDFQEVLNGLVATQAGLTILLLSLGPYTLLWYASFADYNAALFFNALIFGTASVAAQWLLKRYYRPLIARNARHRVLLRIWIVLFAFVGIQTAWILRPFVGAPHLPPQFFRAEAWGNAYVALAEKVHDVFAPPEIRQRTGTQ
ncbi:hypothetical protein ACXR0O_13635 [Verrucomicrobiota bacterium sgz303538]